MKLIKEVFEEALLLNQHTTQEEKDRLWYHRVITHSASKCIYGLMTGDCNNKRALELINKCVVDLNLDRNSGATITTIFGRDYQNVLNMSNVTPIEAMIVSDPSTIPDICNIIKYGIITNN